MGTLALFILTLIPALAFATWWERRRLRRQIAELDRMERDWLRDQWKRETAEAIEKYNRP